MSIQRYDPWVNAHGSIQYDQDPEGDVVFFEDLRALLAERTEREAAMQAMLRQCPMCQGRGTYETRASMATPCLFCAPLRALAERKT